MYDSVLFSPEKLSAFNRIECLILDNIEFDCLEYLLNQLLSLSQLSSSTVTARGVFDWTKIYGQICHLRVLKYCKLSVSARRTAQSLPLCVNECSPIEYLIITHGTDLNELDRLLLYIPHLRRASLYLTGGRGNLRTERCAFVYKQLTHISVRLSYSIKFNSFEKIIRELFPIVEVLRLILSEYFGQLYATVRKWEQLITTHLPYLQIFDIQYRLSAVYHTTALTADTRMNEFSTPFWIARQ